MTRYPEIIGETWLNNTHPLTSEELNGRVVLVDFFTYSCANCIRTIPYLREWWKRYKELKFFIIGVHTPEFDFEKDPLNVAKALKELQIEWPVVLDNDYVNWNNFANHYWPAKYLLDQNGYIVYHHFGEGAYGETEEKIQELLKIDFGNQTFPPVVRDEGAGGFCIIPTPELYCGFQRGQIANKEGYHEGHPGFYDIKDDQIPNNSIALRGNFNAEKEFVESSEDSALLVRFGGSEVNLVMSPAVNELAIVEIRLDGKPLAKEIAGFDTSDSDVVISESRLYNLLKSRVPIQGLLSIKARESSFRAYAFTFSGCVL